MPNASNSFQSHSLSAPDFLPPEHKARPPRSAPPKKSRRALASCFLIVLILIATSCTAILSRSNNSFFVGIKSGFLFRQITHLITGARSALAGEDEDRINFLLLGIGGPGHEGPYLSDTIILASLKPSTGEAAMMSIPRDLIVPTGNGAYQKVNHVYALSQKKGIEYAFKETKRVIGDTFGVPIHYMGVVDFDGFVELIDTVGGVTVMVERPFADSSYPAGPNKYQTVSFKAGSQRMDGKTALTFARSRHGSNGEGSDFARSARQQKIIIATREKLASFDTYFNPRKITQLYSLVNQYTKTDIEPWELVKLIQLGKEVKKDGVTSIVLDDGPQGLLYGGISSIDGAYILQPTSGDYAQLKLLAQSMIQNNRFASETPSIAIQNGTTVPLLASTIEAELMRYGIKPAAIGNAERQQYLGTVIYDYTNGEKKKTRAFLESRFETKAQTTVPLEFARGAVERAMDIDTTSGTATKLDFLVILGEDVLKQGTNSLVKTLTAAELALRNQTTTPTTTDSVTDTDQTPAPGENTQESKPLTDETPSGLTP